ncbi:hypothetical protein [Mycolicibacterium sp.]|uniref:hypothetical protein n=1 Tax=Mycolicibacterium sp. TaxID=2320850 RepID=UPI003D10EEC2
MFWWSSPPSANPSFPTRDELTERYITAAGHNAEQLECHCAPTVFKFAVISEEIHVRSAALLAADRVERATGSAARLVAAGLDELGWRTMQAL